MSATVTTYDDQGNVVGSRDEPVSAEQSNAESMQQAAQNALATNRSYVNLASPSAAQTTAQVKALSRQMNALIRLALGRFDGTD